ncbi:sister chromatid cohesion protein DCC1-like isoform X2 [Limulus polyphemus]|uniref:Sister chromatid cohesion protein DCC1 n=1 Tax=Limulus polyphemus TaxID=6850 RepID=A0ABM1TLJ5_LIMPO|nr:sister chromatid cohesion protein DCC1-like isoform X2 [Limulus polyphemus]
MLGHKQILTSHFGVKKCVKIRTEEDVRRLLHLAKLDEEDLKPVVQSFYLAQDFTREDLKLMEVTPDILNQILEGERVIIRGDKSDPAVLCTDTQTYDIKEAGTSNSLLLLPSVVWPDEAETNDKDDGITIASQEVAGIFHNYLELHLCRPRVQKLRYLMEENLYTGKEYEADNVDVKYTFEDLLNVIQASPKELQTALRELQACCIDGFWRMLDFDYQFSVFNHIVNLVDSNSWPSDGIPLQAVLDTLEDLIPRKILEECFHWYTEPVGRTTPEGYDLYRWNEDKICAFLGEVILRPTGKFNLEEFLYTWQSTVPEGITTNLNQLKVGNLALSSTD